MIRRLLRRARGPFICLVLAVATAAVYGQTGRFDFVLLDDQTHVTANTHVRHGLSAAGLRWILTADQSGNGYNWYPLTTLSHMLAVEFFGLDPGPHHLINAALHLLNTLVLFAVLHAATGSVWKCALVAALFAVHPLHVESVAWVSARKDVLSILCALLAIGAYVAYVRYGGLGRYALVASLLALGLLAKPTLVTLPLVLLLLDYWPLGRMTRVDNHGPETIPAIGVSPPRFGTLLLEKLPLLALSAAMSVLTIVFQRQVGALTEIAPGLRLANAVVSYVRYLAKAFWPSTLSVMYPHPDLPGGTPWTAWQVTGAAILLGGLSLLVWGSGRRYALLGWLWFLGTLVPVIGLMQVGVQAMADRYAYGPLIGLFIIIAWGAGDLIAAPRPRGAVLRAAVWPVTILALVSLMITARRQARHWRDSVSLFGHALAVAPEPPMMHNNLGLALQSQGQRDAAIDHYRRAVEIDPSFTIAHTNLGIQLRLEGKLDEAIHHYREVLRVTPRSPIAHTHFGLALQSQGRIDEAISHYRQALEADAEFTDAHFNLGGALQSLGRVDEAIRYYERVLEIAPDYAPACNNLAVALRSQGRTEEAIGFYRQAVTLQPAYVQAHVNLGDVLAEQHRLDEAAAHYRQALQLRPDLAQVRSKLAVVLRIRRERDAASAQPAREPVLPAP
jgi:tetratricopeptide (TPR) repeat protein